MEKQSAAIGRRKCLHPRLAGRRQGNREARATEFAVLVKLGNIRPVTRPGWVALEHEFQGKLDDPSIGSRANHPEGAGAERGSR